MPRALSLLEVAYAVPTRMPTAQERVHELGIASAERMMTSHFFGLDRVPLLQQETYGGLVSEACRGLERLPALADTVTHVVAARTNPVIHWQESQELHEACAELGLIRATVLSTTQLACASGLGALSVANALLPDVEDGATCLVVAGEPIPNIGFAYIPGTTLMSEAVSVALVRRCSSGARIVDDITSVCGQFFDAELPGGQLLAFQQRYPVAVTEVVQRLAERNGITLDDVEIFLPMNVNTLSWRRLAAQWDVPAERFWLDNVTRLAHAYGADVFINYADALAAGRLRAGDYAIGIATGLGATFSAVLLQQQD